jgi:large subunit ribosomal protein L24e
MKCSFCGKVIKTGTGKMYVKNDGTIYYWCTKKCEKNFNMGRNPKKVKWVIKKQSPGKKK